MQTLLSECEYLVSHALQRGEQEVKVMVRYPRSERSSVGNLEKMWIRLPDGRELPFSAVANYEMSRGYDTIERYL